MSVSCGNIPVDVPYVVSILVFTYFAESHSFSLEGGMVFAREDLVGQGPRADFNLPDPNLLQGDFLRAVRRGDRHFQPVQIRVLRGPQPRRRNRQGS